MTLVALHPEGVDRNRQAACRKILRCRVALHPEGVDRNCNTVGRVRRERQSPSTRRAWIEIFEAAVMMMDDEVALHPEGVDRNALSAAAASALARRPPPGGRG